MLGVAAALVLNAFQSNLVFFFTPTQIAANEAPEGPRVPHRRAGRGKEPRARAGRPDRALHGHRHRRKTCRCVYNGILPDLFKEGKGVVAQGQIGPDGIFHASEVLAKHDENYMPPEAADAVNKAHGTAAAAEKTAKTLQR